MTDEKNIPTDEIVGSTDGLACPYCLKTISPPYHDLFEYEDQGTQTFRCACGEEFAIERDTKFSVRKYEG